MAKLRHIAMAVPDIEAAAAFYEKTFELQRVKQTKKRIYLSDGTINLTLLPSNDLAGDAREGFVGLHHLGFVVEDTEATEGRLAENGGKIVETGGLGDLVLLELFIKGAAAYAQTLGGLLFIPTTILKHFQEQLALVLYQGRRLRPLRSLCGGMEGGGQV